MAVAQEGSWGGGGARALEVVATGFAQLWQAKQEAARLKKEEESASFKFRERTVEMKSEEELDEQVSP